MNHHSLRGVIFDLGWTLMDFPEDIAAMEPLRARDLARFLSARGLQADGQAVFDHYREELLTLWQVGRPHHYEYPARLAMLRALRRHLPSSQASDLAADALDASFASVLPRWTLYPDTLDTLASLRDAGYRLGAISNTNDGSHVWRLVERFGLGAWLSPILLSDEVGFRKPHPRPFRIVLDQWGLSPEAVVMVGDTLNADVLGAQNLGMRGIWIDRGETNPWSQNEASKATITPDATIHRLAELPQLLANHV